MLGFSVTDHLLTSDVLLAYGLEEYQLINDTVLKPPTVAVLQPAIPDHKNALSSATKNLISEV